MRMEGSGGWAIACSGAAVGGRVGTRLSICIHYTDWVSNPSSKASVHYYYCIHKFLSGNSSLSICTVQDCSIP